MVGMGFFDHQTYEFSGRVWILRVPNGVPGVPRAHPRRIASLKLTAKAPENRQGPKRKRSHSNHPFSGANC